jgi:predicted phosphate transport protein (TIGR00153 family)
MPKEERFHELFAQDTANLVRAAHHFTEFAHLCDLDARRIKMAQLRACEHEGDTLTGQIFEALNSSFITPFDREDIRSLATDLDDVLDYVEGVAQQLLNFELHESPEGLRQFADILVEMAVEIERITGMLWNLANQRQIHEAIVRISALENRADLLYNAVITDLFKANGRDPLEILKWKEIYEGLENACDQCRDFTHIVGNVLVKYA